MSLREVRRVLGDAAARLKGNAPEVPLDDCAYLNSKRLPKGLGLMFAKGRVVRIDVNEVSSKPFQGQRLITHRRSTGSRNLLWTK